MILKRLILPILLLTTNNAAPMGHVFQFAIYPWLLFYNVLFKTTYNTPSQRKNLSLVKSPTHIPRTFDFHHFSAIVKRININILEESIAFCPAQLKEKMDKRDYSTKLFCKKKLVLPCTNRLLLHGPNQNGKTTLAYSIAHTYQNNFFHISSPALYDQYTYGYKDIIDELVDPLSRSNEPAIIILEAIHILCKMENIKDHPNRGVAQYFLEKIKVAHIFNPHLLIVGITDSPEELSSDFQEYFKNSTYQISPPLPSKRYSIVKSFLFRNGFFDEKAIRKITSETHNLSLGNINSALQKSRFYAEIDAVENHRPPKRLSLSYIEDSFKDFLPDLKLQE